MVEHEFALCVGDYFVRKKKFARSLREERKLQKNKTMPNIGQTVDNKFQSVEALTIRPRLAPDIAIGLRFGMHDTVAAINN